jgi:hypothetical protein
VEYRCLRLAGSPSGDGINDTLEYWFGASSINETAGQVEEGNMFDVLGVDTPLTGTSFGFNGEDSAQNQNHSASFPTTSGRLDPAQFPQFTSWAAAKYDRPGGPFAPHTGDYYAYSQIADVSYKQLMRTITVPPGGGNLLFWTSYDTEPDWDCLFVEAHTVGQDDNWETTTADGFPEGAVVATPQTVYMRFGFEGITGASTRAEVMGRVMAYLLP